MNKPTIKEYRCTRSELYRHECIGRDDLSARQGHYVEAENARDAWLEMARRFPGESDFTITELHVIREISVAKCAGLNDRAGILARAL